VSGINHSQSLRSLLKRRRDEFGVPEPSAQSAAQSLEDPINQLVWSFLLWNSMTSKAEPAMRRLRASFVDLNELRVSLPHEIAAALGERYPLCQERALRLRLTLNDIFYHENAVSLTRLHELQKREAREYLESLEGIPPYVVARVLLLSLGGHAIPVDDRLTDALIDEGVLEPGTSVEHAASVLARHIKAADAREAHLLLQQWSEQRPESAAETEAGEKSSTRRKRAGAGKSASKKKGSSAPRAGGARRSAKSTL